MRWGLLRARLRLMAAATLTVLAPTAMASTAVALNLSRGHEAAAPAGGATTTTATTTTTPEAATPRELAERYAPILRLDSAELLIPISRDRYVRHTDLWTYYDRKLGIDRRIKDQDFPEFSVLPDSGPHCPGFRSCHYYLQVPTVGQRPSAGVRPFHLLQEEVLREGGRPIVYWHWAASDDTLEYWFFYDFNYFTNWHASDWEQITLRLDPSSRTPLRVGYSSHEGGQGTDWSTLVPGYQKFGDRPVVFVARGSHANYFDAGSHPVRECRYLGPKICKPDRADGLGPRLTPAEYRLVRLDGTRSFAGDYGTGNFLKTPAGLKALGTGINVSDPQSRRMLWDHPADWLVGNREPDPPRPNP